MRLLTEEKRLKVLNGHLENYLIPVYRECIDRAQDKATLKAVVKLIEKYNKSVWGGFSGDIPPLTWEAFKRGKMPEEAKE